MNIYNPVFSTAQTAAAAGMTATNFRAHLARGNWQIGRKSEAAESLGKGHVFSIYDVLGYALAAELMDAGIDPKTAFDRAMLDFAHVGDTKYEGTEPIIREPGGVFDFNKYGWTLFSYSPGSERGECYATKLLGDPMMLLHQRGGSFAAKTIVVDLNKLRDRVFNSLKLDARDYE